MEMSGELHVPAALTLGNILLPIGYEVDWVPQPVWTFRKRQKFVLLIGFKP
jgi:hypothetical protein